MRRVYIGKEDKQRYQERFGYPSQPRPSGQLIWIHAVSIGESLATLPLIELLLAQNPKLHILVTTGTVTSATLMRLRLPVGCIHQYVPIDVPRWGTRFLDYWQPSTVIFIESDLWPNLFLTCKQRQIPVILLNSRFSLRSQKRFLALPRTAHTFFSSFNLIVTQAQKITNFIAHFNHPNVVTAVNIKFAAAPLTYGLTDYQSLKADIGDRPLWLAVSTHPGEEQIIGEVHRRLQEKFPRLLTIIIPRHSKRTPQIVQELKNISTVCRTKNPRIPNDCQIYIADTLGETGLFYALSPIVFVAGSFAPGIGGHNPIEPALLDCAILWGPHIYNSQEICDLLESAARQVQTPDELVQAIETLLTHPEEAARLANEVKQLVKTHQQIFQKIIPLLKPYLDVPNVQKPALLA